MGPIVVDPVTYDKYVVIREAILYAQAFLDLNGISHPREYLFVPDDAKKPAGKNPWHNNGWYWNGIVFVNLKRSRAPVKTPGFAWSFTGFKADLTAPGILAHEIGHHTHFELLKRSTEGSSIDDIKKVAKVEAPVSGYEPNPYEVMAEALRLFILNPSLLREGRPKRWEMITRMGLEPLHDVPWRDVLVNAHPRIINAAAAWINR